MEISDKYIASKIFKWKHEKSPDGKKDIWWNPEWDYAGQYPLPNLTSSEDYLKYYIPNCMPLLAKHNISINVHAWLHDDDNLPTYFINYDGYHNYQNELELEYFNTLSSLLASVFYFYNKGTLNET